MKKSLAITLFILLCATVSHAQFFGLGIAPGGFVPSAGSAPFGDTLYYNITVQNKGNSIYTGNISILSITNSDSTITVFPFGSPVGVVLPAGDTVQDVIGEVVMAPRFGGGGGATVVIVWPVSDNPTLFPTSDSASTVVDITTAIQQPDWDAGGLKVFPNPASSILYLDYGSIVAEVERVRLTDAAGKVLFGSGVPVESVSLVEYPPGTYFLQIWGGNGKVAVFRIIRFP
jgi:hypothetical protein